MVKNLHDILNNQDVNKADSFAQHIVENTSSTTITVHHNALDAIINDNVEY
jgi:hypothetical protein